MGKQTARLIFSGDRTRYLLYDLFLCDGRSRFSAFIDKLLEARQLRLPLTIYGTDNPYASLYEMVATGLGVEVESKLGVEVPTIDLGSRDANDTSAIVVILPSMEEIPLGRRFQFAVEHTLALLRSRDPSTPEPTFDSLYLLSIYAMCGAAQERLPLERIVFSDLTDWDAQRRRFEGETAIVKFLDFDSLYDVVEKSTQFAQMYMGFRSGTLSSGPVGKESPSSGITLSPEASEHPFNLIPYRKFKAISAGAKVEEVGLPVWLARPKLWHMEDLEQTLSNLGWLNFLGETLMGNDLSCVRQCLESRLRGSPEDEIRKVLGLDSTADYLEFLNRNKITISGVDTTEVLTPYRRWESACHDLCISLREAHPFVWPDQLPRLSADGLEDNGYSFRCEGDTWLLRFEGSDLRLKDTDGMNYLAFLLDRRGDLVDASRMRRWVKSNPSDTSEAMSAATDAIELTVRSAVESGTDITDRKAVAAAKRKVSELRALLEEGESTDPSAKLLCESELKKLEDYVKRSTRPSGASRRFSDDTQSNAENVRKSLKRSFRLIKKHSPKLAEHLEQNVQFGSTLRYRGSFRWSVQLKSRP